MECGFWWYIAKHPFYEIIFLSQDSAVNYGTIYYPLIILNYEKNLSILLIWKGVLTCASNRPGIKQKSILKKYE